MYPILWELTEGQARVVLAVAGVVLLGLRLRRSGLQGLRFQSGDLAWIVPLAVAGIGLHRIPYLRDVGFPIEFPAYFTFLVVGFALAILVSRRWAQKGGWDFEAATDLGLYMLIAGVIGSRILHVFVDGFFWDYVHLCTDPSKVVWHITESRCTSADVGGIWDAAERICRPGHRDCFAWAKFWNGGLVYYGGFLGAAGYGMWFVRRQKLPFWKTVDMTGYAIVLGLVWGRMGCFMGGCCFGSPTEAAWGVRYGPWSPASEAQHDLGLLTRAAEPSLPVHPAQLYEAFGCAAIFFYLALWLEPRKRFDGHVFLSFVALYATLRFVVEFFRADMRGALLSLSTSQWIGVGLLAAAAYGWRRLSDVKVPG